MDYLEKMVGASVKKIFMSHEYLTFETDKGDFGFTVDAECCSTSYFYDFYGVKNLLQNGAILRIKDVAVYTSEVSQEQYTDAFDDDVTECYGFQFTTMSPEFGKVTSVFSFRNESNGYYGGSLEESEVKKDIPEITDDVIEIKTP